MARPKSVTTPATQFVAKRAPYSEKEAEFFALAGEIYMLCELRDKGFLKETYPQIFHTKDTPVPQTEEPVSEITENRE